MASRTCDNCGQPVLRTDVTCWHCGAKLAPAAPSSSAAADARPSASTTDTPRAPHALLYAGLTTAVALALLLVTATLGRRPLLLQGVTGGAGDWVALRAMDGSYQINVPAGWSWQQAQDQASGAELLVRQEGEPRLQVALAPLSGLLEQEELLLLATDEAAFLLLARSPNLAQLAIPDFVAAVQTESFNSSTVHTATATTNDRSQPAALLDVSQVTPALHCRQLVLPGERWGYLAAACAPEEQSGAYAERFATMLGSLQARD